MDNNEQVLSRFREDILIRGLSKGTLETYTLNVRIFLTYCNRPVDELDVEDIRKFLQYLIHEKKSLPGTVNTYSAAIRFLFAVTLNLTLNYLQIPARKGAKPSPKC
ncbi:site-specific integrase [Paenibacillus sp. Soil522]|uniref:site-specific integrase n=1 Tax=Paenibacillus sp. Soil522 TaxID=1736388 RepID=UPI000A826EDD|nr:site-specific integrase [Paenibacillus sp. Soil522]